MKGCRERFTHYARVFWIDHQMRADRYPNTRTIAEHFEVTRKTAQRTLEFMRDQLRLPIEYSAEHRGWYYTEEDFVLPGLTMTEGELVAILLAEKLARAYRKTTLGRQIEQAFAKVLNTMNDVVSIDFNALVEAYSFEAPVVTEVNPDIFRLLGRASKERLRVEMTYYTATSGSVTRRRADPLRLRNYLGEWYLIAFDHLRGGVRDFHVGRIRELKLTDERFEWPEGFDLAAYLDSGFAMIRGGRDYDVEIDFDEYQARWMRERGPVHPTETREELPGGGLRIRMRVTALDGVKRFVMQYGSHARVLSPVELLESVREEVAALSALYGEHQHRTDKEKP
jgi:predicted DNA-binding transcriptional regulator YafY